MSKDQLEEWDETATNNTDIGGTSLVDSVATIDTLDTIFNELMAQTAKWLGADTLASATTTDLGSVPGRYVSVTGTTTITGFGTIKDGTIKIVKFGGILTLTHNGTSLILPGAANITTAAGDVALMGSEGSGNWRCLSYQRASGLGLSEVADDTSPTLGGNLAGAGYDLTGLGTVSMTEQAAANADVAGDGQWWVQTATPNLPMFTNDAGTDFQLATLTGTETLTNKTLGAVTLSGAVTGADQTVSAINIKDYGEITNAIGSIGGGTQDIDLTAGNVVSGTVDTSTTTFTFSNPTASDEGCSFTLVLTNGGSQTVNWPASVDWAGGTAPTLTASGVDILTFFTIDGGTTWFGFTAGLDMQ